MTDNQRWVAHAKGAPGSFEISVCYGEPNVSWGWFGRAKIHIEGGNFEDAKARAERIAAALNAAGFDPNSPETRIGIMTSWQPIATAPRDGTEVLVTDGRSYAVAEWQEGFGWRDAGDMGWAGMVDAEPTHWMPLPEPPEFAMAKQS